MAPARGDNPKRAAVDVWTQAPCGLGSRGERTGDAAHVEEVLAAADRHSPWLPAALREERAAGLEILDVGCGPGIQLVRLARRGARVTGIDLVEAHVEQARANLAAVGLHGEAAVGDAEALDLPDERFDRVLSVNAIQFTPDFDRALRELRRVLRPGGDATVVVYHRGAWFWWRYALIAGLLQGELVRTRGDMSRVIARNLPWGARDTDMIARAFSRRGLRRRMEAAGLRDVEVEVRGFALDHLAPFGLALRRIPAFRDPKLLDAIGRRAGWYAIARGTR